MSVRNAKINGGQTYKNFVCPECNQDFKLSLQRSHKLNPCCSRICGGKKSLKTKNRNLSNVL